MSFVADWEIDNPLRDFANMRSMMENGARRSDEAGEVIRSVIAAVDRATTMLEIINREWIINEARDRIIEHESQITYLRGKLAGDDE